MSTTDEQRPEPMAYMVTRKIRTNQDGRARYLHLNKERAEEDFDLWQEAEGADPVLIPLYAAASEPAAPVDARDAQRQNDFALGRLQGIQQERALWELSAIAQAESQAAQQAPTPAVLFESMSPAEQRAAGESLYAIWDASRSAKLTPATAEPAAPVDARDALDASRYRWLREQARYVDTDNGAMSMTGNYFMSVSARNVGPWLPKSARYDFETLDAACDAALARQAAAPAEGEK